MGSFGMQNERFAWYLSQNKGFRGVVIFHEKWCKKWSENDVKIDLWALRDRIFEILISFWERRFFDDFLIGKKLAKNWEFCSSGRQKVLHPGALGRGRRQRRWRQGLRYRQITARNWQELGKGSARSCPETGDGGFNGYRLMPPTLMKSATK